MIINSKTVVAKDSVVKAKVSHARKPGMMGRSGKLSVIIESTMTLDGQVLKLRAAKSGNSGDNFRTTYTLVVLFGAAGLLKHGKNSTIDAGTVITTYADESKSVMVRDIRPTN